MFDHRSIPTAVPRGLQGRIGIENVYNGGSGPDTFDGTSGNDTFNMAKGGNDTVNGEGGDDTFNFGAALTAADRINGGSGNDVLNLNGDYTGTHAVAFGASTVRNVETINLAGGHSYDFTLNAATISTTGLMLIDGTALAAGDTLTLNGAATKAGSLLEVNGGAGNDALTGGAGLARFFLFEGGNDTATAGSGGAEFNMGASLTPADRLDGGSGGGEVDLNGDYSAGLVLKAATLKHIFALNLAPGDSYTITTADGNLDAGSTMTVYGWTLAAGDRLKFDGSAETNGHFNILGGADQDTLKGGALSDTITGGGWSDLMNGEGGADTFVYNHVSDSTSSVYDIITGFDFRNMDHIKLGYAVTGINPEVTHGALQTGNFDSDMAAAIGAAQLGKHHAVLFKPDSGNLSGNNIKNDVFLIIDANNVAGYQAGKDYVILLSFPAHIANIDTSDFTT